MQTKLTDLYIIMVVQNTNTNSHIIRAAAFDFFGLAGMLKNLVPETGASFLRPKYNASSKKLA